MKTGCTVECISAGATLDAPGRAACLLLQAPNRRDGCDEMPPRWEIRMNTDSREPQKGGLMTHAASWFVSRRPRRQLEQGDTMENKDGDTEHRKGDLRIHPRPIVSEEEWEAARQKLLVK